MTKDVLDQIGQGVVTLHILKILFEMQVEEQIQRKTEISHPLICFPNAGNGWS